MFQGEFRVHGQRTGSHHVILSHVRLKNTSETQKNKSLGFMFAVPLAHGSCVDSVLPLPSQYETLWIVKVSRNSLR